MFFKVVRCINFGIQCLLELKQNIGTTRVNFVWINYFSQVEKCKLRIPHRKDLPTKQDLFIQAAAAQLLKQPRYFTYIITMAGPRESLSYAVATPLEFLNHKKLRKIATKVVVKYIKEARMGTKMHVLPQTYIK